MHALFRLGGVTCDGAEAGTTTSTQQTLTVTVLSTA